MTTFEDAIFAAAFVDALRNIYEGLPLRERVQQSEREATLVVEAWREHAVNARPGGAP